MITISILKDLDRINYQVFGKINYQSPKAISTWGSTYADYSIFLSECKYNWGKIGYFEYCQGCKGKV